MSSIKRIDEVECPRLKKIISALEPKSRSKLEGINNKFKERILQEYKKLKQKYSSSPSITKVKLIAFADGTKKIECKNLKFKTYIEPKETIPYCFLCEFFKYECEYHPFLEQNKTARRDPRAYSNSLIENKPKEK